MPKRWQSRPSRPCSHSCQATHAESNRARPGSFGVPGAKASRGQTRSDITKVSCTAFFASAFFFMQSEASVACGFAPPMANSRPVSSLLPMPAYELLVGLRYTRAKRRNHFISFISATSMAGIALGVAALIVVLSVMNGFQHELRDRILGVASHVQISGANNQLKDWQAVAKSAAQEPRVLAAAPFVNAQGMLAAGQAVRGAVVRGILPELEDKVAEIGQHMRAGSLAALRPGEFGIVLGSELARALGSQLGDK